jgi:ethanolamine utilization protein EutA
MRQDLVSVGIDVGTSTVQVVFSRLSVADTAGYFAAPKVDIVGKELIYKGGIHETPLLSAETLDAEGLRSIVSAEFARAGFAEGKVDTGAVIITGESARKENARRVLELLSGMAGDFVVSTAGPDLEALIAGQGSGARDWSSRHMALAANLDIGGGTTNIALFEGGAVKASGSYDVGGRLVRVEKGRIRSVSKAAQTAAEWKGISLRPGDPADPGPLSGLCRALAEVLEMAMGLRPAEAILEKLRTPGAGVFRAETLPDAVFLSGGVADLVYRAGDEIFAYGDIGVLLGRALRQSGICNALRLLRGGETIRATVVGAGSHTVSLSGSTVFYTEGVFPLRNLPVLRLTPEEEAASYRGEGEEVAGKIRWFLSQHDTDQLAIAMAGLRNPGYAELNAAAGVFARAAESVLPASSPLVIVTETDMAKALGQLTQSRLGKGRAAAVLDSIPAKDHTYLDIGMPLMGGIVVPVVIKTLIFK